VIFRRRFAGLVARQLDLFGREEAALLAECERAERAYDGAPRSLADELPKLKTKSLLLWGNQDRGVSVERGLLLFQLIPNAEFHLFDQCAHWVQWDQAERFNRLVSDFLQG